jgi:hypothetical protein
MKLAEFFKTSRLNCLSRSGLAVAVMTAVVMASFSVGCSGLGNQKANSEKPMQFQAGENACLNTLSTNLRMWIEAGKPDIGVSIDCSLKALDEFTKDTHGQQPDSWSSEEISNFISTYFAKDGTIMGNNALAWTRAGMRIKQLVFGGSADRASRAEVARVRSLLVAAKPLLQGVSPYIGLIFLRDDKPASDSDPAAAGAAAVKLTELIATQLDQSPERPGMDLPTFVQNLRLLGFKNGNLESWLPIAQTVKAIAVGGDETSVTADLWPSLIRTAGQGWSLLVRIKYSVVKADDPIGAELPQLASIVTDVFSLLTNAVNAQGSDGRGIDIQLLDHLIDGMSQPDLLSDGQNLLPAKVQASTIKGLFPILLGKILNGNSLADEAAKSRALQMSHVGVLQDAFSDWYSGQKSLLLAFNGLATIAPSNLSQAVEQAFQSDTALVAVENRLSTVRARTQLAELLTTGRPLVRDNAGRLVVVHRDHSPPLRRSDTDLLNEVRVLAGIIFRGYSHDPNIAQSTGGLTEAEMQEVYLDLRDLGKDLNFMDIRNDTAGTRTFMEMSIFTSTAHAAERVDIHEAVDWFHVVSSGGKQADAIYNTLLTKYKCGVDQTKVANPVDVLGNVKLDAHCFRGHFMVDFVSNFANLGPNLGSGDTGMIKWIKADPDAAHWSRLSSLMMSLENAGRHLGYTDDPVESTEFRAMIPILYYTEIIFATHDTNENDLLDTDEIWAMFPSLAPFIQKMANGAANDAFTQKAIFAYLLTYAKPPAPPNPGAIRQVTPPKSFKDLPAFLQNALGWVGDVAKQAVDPAEVALQGVIAAAGDNKATADRLAVLKLIASFADSARQDRERSIADYLAASGATLRGAILNHDTGVFAQLTGLFACQQPATSIVGDVLTTNVDQLAAAAGFNATQFETGFKKLIFADPRLQSYCLPF